jgi:hypothetical protein
MNRRRHMMEDLEQDIRHHIAIETQAVCRRTKREGRLLRKCWRFS